MGSKPTRCHCVVVAIVVGGGEYFNTLLSCFWQNKQKALGFFEKEKEGKCVDKEVCVYSRSL